MLLTAASIFVLLLLSAFFSGSETALTAASRPLMHRLELQGNPRAAMVARLHEHKERLIGAILLGNNLVNILASSLATSMLIITFGETGVVYATLVMTLLVLIFAEILPKTYAFRNANQMALYIAPIVSVIVAVLSPITHTINLIVTGVFKVFGIDFDTERAMASSDEELRGAIELHVGEENAADTRDLDAVRHERAMLRSVLDLQDVTVGEIMTHRKNVTAISASLPPDELVAEVLSSPYTRVPIWQDDPDNIVGVIHAKALLRAVREAEVSQSRDLAGLNIEGLASAAWFVPDTTTLLDQLQAFRARREHFCLVVDEYGSLMGIVTLEDILEEIVGEISDEHDQPVTGVRHAADGSYLVQGTVTIRDLNREYEWGLPDEEAATIAGLVLHEARRIPDVGQAFMFHGFRFEIMRRQRHQITQIRVTPPSEGAESAEPPQVD